MKNLKFLCFVMVIGMMMSCEPTDLEQEEVTTVVSDTGDQRDVHVNEKEEEDL